MIERLIAEIPKNSREIFRVSIREDGKKLRIDIRTYETHGKIVPASTNRGVSLRPEYLAAIIAALESAAEELGTRRLIVETKMIADEIQRRRVEVHDHEVAA